MKIPSSFTHPHIIQNLYNFLLRLFKEYFTCFFIHVMKVSVVQKTLTPFNLHLHLVILQI